MIKQNTVHKNIEKNHTLKNLEQTLNIIQIFIIFLPERRATVPVSFEDWI